MRIYVNIISLQISFDIFFSCRSKNYGVDVIMALTGTQVKGKIKMRDLET